MEVQNAKQKQQIEEGDYELIKLQKSIKDLIEEKDVLLAQINEAETGKDSTFGELKKARALNTELDLKLKAVSERLQESDPTIVKQ